MSNWELALLPIYALIALAIASILLGRRQASRRDISHREHRARLIRLGFHSMEEYRRSQLWRDKRREYRRSDYPQRCLVCSSREFDLHHRSYARLGEEELFDLVPLCRRHHDKLHELLDADPRLCVKDTYDHIPLLKDRNAPNRCEDRGPGGRFRRRAARKSVSRRHEQTTSVAKRASRTGMTWTKDEDTNLLNDYATGVSLEQLATRLHRSVKSVEVRLAKLGHLPNPDHGRG
jgi:hypothetical protein